MVCQLAGRLASGKFKSATDDGHIPTSNLANIDLKYSFIHSFIHTGIDLRGF